MGKPGSHNDRPHGAECGDSYYAEGRIDMAALKALLGAYREGTEGTK